MRSLALLVAPLALALAACAPDEPRAETAAQSALIANRNLDILFMIDDSSSMRLSQTNLLANFPGFMDVLKNLPGGLPNIHVAVVSSDMGAGDGSFAACDATRRRQRHLPVHADAGPARRRRSRAGATYLSNVGGRRQLHAATSRRRSRASPRWARPAAASSISSRR